MAEYTFWAIKKDYITWNADGNAFVINDTSKFVQFTYSDDDPYMEDTWGLKYGPDGSWERDDRETGENATFVSGPEGTSGDHVASASWFRLADFPEGKGITVSYDYLAFSGINPGDIAEGEAVNVIKWTGNEGPTGSGSVPTIAYSDIVNPVCFTANTLIETADGNKPVEDLRPGDMIATMDNGYQPIRWIGSTARDAVDLAHHPKLKPVRIPAGALGGGLPKRDLTVGRQHRVLVRSKIAQRMFGAEEILIPAIKLVGLAGIEIVEDCDSVTYFHILFDKHQVIFSEDAPTESLFTGPVALQSVSPEARKEIEILFPEITEPDFVAQSARPIPAKGAQIKQLVERHKKRDMPLLNN